MDGSLDISSLGALGTWRLGRRGNGGDDRCWEAARQPMQRVTPRGAPQQRSPPPYPRLTAILEWPQIFTAPRAAQAAAGMCGHSGSKSLASPRRAKRRVSRRAKHRDSGAIGAPNPVVIQLLACGRGRLPHPDIVGGWEASELGGRRDWAGQPETEKHLWPNPGQSRPAHREAPVLSHGFSALPWE